MSEKNKPETEIIYVDAEPIEDGYEAVPVDSEAHTQFQQQTRVYTARSCSPCCAPPSRVSGIINLRGLPAE